MINTLNAVTLVLLAFSLHACDSDRKAPAEESANNQSVAQVEPPNMDSIPDPTLPDQALESPGQENSEPQPTSPGLADPAGPDTVQFLSADWLFTAFAANNALNLPELKKLRNAVDAVFPAEGQIQGTVDRSCDKGDARVTVQGAISVYEFNGCDLGGAILNGSYQTDSSSELTGSDTKTKFDDDFDISLVTADESIYIVGNSKLGVLEKAADECGFVKFESVLRQDVLQVINSGVTVDNLTLEDIITSDIDAGQGTLCGLQTETLAFSASATLTTTQATGEMFTTRANRNGRIIKNSEGDFVDAGEDRNAKLTVYHSPSDTYMSVYATDLDKAEVTIKDGLTETEKFIADFVFQ